MDLLQCHLSECSNLFFSENLDIVSTTSNEKFGELTIDVSQENGIVFVQAICDGVVEDTRCGTKVETKLGDNFETLAQTQREFFHTSNEANDTRSVQSSIEIAERNINEPLKVLVNDWKSPEAEESVIEMDASRTFLSSGASFVFLRLLAQTCTEAVTVPFSTLDVKGKLANLKLSVTLKRAILRDNEGEDNEQMIVSVEKQVENADNTNEFWHIFLKQTGELLHWAHVGDPVVMRASEHIIDFLPDDHTLTDEKDSESSWEETVELSESSFGLSHIFGSQTVYGDEKYSMSGRDVDIESDTDTSFLDLSHAESEEMANYDRHQSATLPPEETDPFLMTRGAQNPDQIDLVSAIVGAVPTHTVQERNSQMSFHADEEYFQHDDAGIGRNLEQVLEITVTDWVNEAMDEAVSLEQNLVRENVEQQNDGHERSESNSPQSDSIDYNLAWLFGQDEDVQPIGDSKDSKPRKKRPQISWQMETPQRLSAEADTGGMQSMSPIRSARSKADSLASENMPELMRMFDSPHTPSIIAISPYVRPQTPNPIDIPTDDEGFHSQMSSQTPPTADETIKYEPGKYSNLWMKFKQNTSLNCYQYLEQHPELTDMLTDYLQCLLMTQPKDIGEFSAMYFTVLNSMK